MPARPEGAWMRIFCFQSMDMSPPDTAHEHPVFVVPSKPDAGRPSVYWRMPMARRVIAFISALAELGTDAPAGQFGQTTIRLIALTQGFGVHIQAIRTTVDLRDAQIDKF